MLNLNTTTRVIPMPITPNYRILINNKEATGYGKVIMTYITEEEEGVIDLIADKAVDVNTVIKLERGNKTFSIKAPQIYCYGEVDFNSNEDLDRINKFNFLSGLSFQGAVIPSDYNYERHECCSPIKQYRYSETWKPAVVAKIAHGFLGKPKRVIIFKCK